MIVKSGFKYRYDVQSAFYTDGAMTLTGNPYKFWFCFVEKEPPHLLTLADSHAAFCESADASMPLFYLEQGRAAYKEALKTIKECRESGYWAGHGGIVHEMVWPKWADIVM